jgi:hypothetical protein
MLLLYRSFLRRGGRPSKRRLLDLVIPPKERCLATARPWRIVASSHFASFTTGSSTTTKSAANQHCTPQQEPLPPSSATTTTEKSSKDNTSISNRSTTTSDPPVLTWVETALPKVLIPYARLARIDKPIGTMLLVSNTHPLT